ncbi:guanylyl cyclase 1 isoform X1 [Carex rostrata]
MWPLCVISDKFAKMIGEGEEKQECDPDNSISSSCRAYHVDVPHVRQMCNWDCGLACVLMVLRTLGIDSYDITDLEEFCSTTSIWTVDLAYLLHKFSVNFSFLTVTVGVNPSYSAQSFYQEQLEDDTGRVIDLFAKAIHAGISIQCRTISVHDISLLLLSGRCIAIALVDKTKLHSSWKDDGTGNYLDGTSEYIGHYIVICGFDAGTNDFEIRDPASSRKYERVSMECLDEARKSFGTDEDILLVSLDGTDGNKLSPNLLVY